MKLQLIFSVFSLFLSSFILRGQFQPQNGKDSISRSMSEVGHLWPTDQIQPAMCIYKILLEYGHSRLWTYCLWLLSHYKGSVEQLQQRPHGPQRLIFTVYLFTKKVYFSTLLVALSWGLRNFLSTIVSKLLVISLGHIVITKPMQ